MRSGSTVVRIVRPNPYNYRQNSYIYRITSKNSFFMHNAHLYIDGLRIPISNFYYHFYQMTDERSKPVSRVLGGEFGFSYEPTKNNLSLTEWMVDPFETKKGYIEIMSFRELKIAAKLEFELAYAVDLAYYFNCQRYDFPFEARLIVRAGALRVNRHAVYLQNWIRKDPFKVEQTKVVSSRDLVEEQPIFEEGYFTDFDDNKLEKEELKVGDSVYYVINTKEAVGQMVDIDLSDSAHDFKYNGQVLPNDLLEDFKITANSCKVKLQVVRQPTIEK